MPVHKHADKPKGRPKLSIRRGDTVVVTAGKDKGKRGKVVAVFPEDNRVEVENINLVKRHMKRQGVALQAGIIEKPAPISRANVMLVCPHCNRPTRIAHGEQEETNGNRERHPRVCKHCGEVVTVEDPAS
jgi:large subunit ribosomal protein L24